ncbi:maleylpyruvate isomerase family mycothiol-dependent enzyme [Amycolatopsis nigrescens]|uniref:maleylpyruvate isomerase family mycothiol-dependent enzyme n=1 Tax=Amycolatopsis nigrescens TaxID=381445 RepID=UPI000371CBA6|nr:maleylpyruvate isomerase family mycothiol-dependent enzyme [Amycolatopsis nigrescens]
MRIAEFVETVGQEGRLFAAAAERADAAAPVATCPGWLMRDLVIHLGSVHRWATAFVAEGGQQPVGLPEAPELSDDALVPWFREGHGRLVETLSSAPPDLACWTFLPASSPVAFWTRRQAHETAVHRVDAEIARGGQLSSLRPAFAADGIDELLAGFYPGAASVLRVESPKTLRFRATDVPEATWTLHLSDGQPRAERTEAGAADCVYEGTAADLYLVLWNRLPLDAVTITGDIAVAHLLRDLTSS